MKKQKTIATMTTNSSTSHMLVEIVEPHKEGKFHELAPTDFHIRTIDMGVLVHDSMVNIWKSINVRIEEKLEELRTEKEALKASNKELMNYIKATLGSTLQAHLIQVQRRIKIYCSSYNRRDILVKLGVLG